MITEVDAQTARTLGEVLLSMENNRAAVEALGHLVSVSLDEGSSHEKFSNGIFHLFMFLVSDAANTEKALRGALYGPKGLGASAFNDAFGEEVGPENQGRRNASA